MSKYVIDSSTLTSIADAVRAKTGKTATIKVSDIPTEISKISGGGEAPPDKAFVITGDCMYRFYKTGWNWFIEKYGDKITTKEITNASYMFNQSEIRNIPFDINFEDTGSYNNSQEMFYKSYIRKAPVLNNFHVYTTYGMFNGCTGLRTVPENFADTWNWRYLEKQTNSYTGD